MRKGIYTVTENASIADQVYRLRLEGDTGAITAPGQFVNIALPGFYLRRPISVCDWDDAGLTLIYKAVGAGTEAMTGLTPGAELDLLTGLGNGFDIKRAGERPLLIGGGVGVPPLYGLAKRLVESGRTPLAVFGFGRAADAFYLDEFQALGAEVRVATVDGSLGQKGFVTDALPDNGAYSYYYACGPLPMLKAVWDACPGDGELSFEERMGCGFGACMGCSRMTRSGSKRVCKDGPVFTKEEVVW